jgi:hypothetical protein
MATTADQDTQMADWWKDAFGVVGGLIVAVGVVVYGTLATAYDKFYSELGLTPADVGTQYGKTLGGAAALTIVVCLGMGFTTWAFSAALLSKPFNGDKAQSAARAIAVVLEIVMVALAARFLGVLISLVLLAAFVLLHLGLRWRDPTQERLRWRDPTQRTTLALAAAAAICVTWALLSVAWDILADAQADQVKRGGWVGPPASGDLVFFSVRAMPTELQPTTKSTTAAAFVAERNGHKLRYLGTSNGLLVIYDSTTQEALLLPATQFRNQILNCETARLADERCKKYRKFGPGE